jgi:hypothetical protein
LIFLTAFPPSGAHAQVHYVPVAPPQHLEVGGQYYDGSVGGLRDYLDAVRGSQPDVYSQLDGDVSSLEVRRALGWTIVVGGLLIGTAIALGAMALAPESCETSSFSGVERCSTDFGAVVPYMGIGFGIMALSPLIGWILMPGRSDLLDVINEHNRISPTPMRLQIGYDPRTRLARGELSIRF